ncbi:MAG: hypothetical protein LBD99_04265 [Candidatus Margulisbacteria bacterium]|nr:hypothetical protein [Candidatus Margulisiibacteriota bacterium]
MKRFSLALFWLFSAALASFPVDLLDRSSGASGLARGGAGTASRDQISAPYWNPAGLAHSTRSGLELTYYQNMGLVNHTSLDGVILLNNGLPPLGLNFVQEGINDIPKTVEVNGQAMETGSFADEYRFFNIATAANLNGGLSAGVNYKIISHSIDSYGASGFAADLGLLQMLTRDLYAGLTFRNVISSLEWTTGATEYLARRLTGGLAYRFQLAAKSVQLFGDLDIFNEDQREWALGAESWLIDDIFCLRGGLNSREEFTLGSGFKYYDFHCDLALLFRAPDSQLENSFLFGMGFDFLLNSSPPPSIQDRAPADFQPQVSLQNNELTIFNLDPEQLLEVAVLDPEYNVISFTPAESLKLPVSSGNYTLFFQLKNQQIVRKTVEIK